MPLISVIVPVYDIKNYLRRCINSILRQTFSDYELILIDDGSTDNSEKICECFSLLDNRIVVIHKKNGGVASARNSGLDFASGKYICFIDSDDYILPDFLFVLFSTIEETNSDYVSQNICLVKSDSKFVIAHDSYEIVLRNEMERYNFIINKVLQGKTGWEMCTRIFRHDIIRDNHIRVCETCENYAEDLAFIIIFLFHCKKCCHINYDGYCYYQREDSMMHETRELFKLNAINEVSYFVYCHLKWHGYKYYLNNFPLIHFWIMKTEMVKFFNGKKNLVPKESQKIRKWRWYKKNIKKCICFFGDISQIIGRNTAFDYCNLSYYTLHKSYKVYFLIDVFFYKYWIRIKNVKN